MINKYSFSNYTPPKSLESAHISELAKEMWDCVSRPTNINKMLEAIANGNTPLLPLDKELHNRFSDKINASNINSDNLRVLCKNMMKQILETQGYKHVACTLIPNGKFARDCGLFEKVSA